MTEQTIAGNTFRCCPGCAYRESWSVKRYIEQGIDALPDGTWVCFLTITEPSAFRSVQEHAEAVSAYLEDIWEMLGGALPYCAVREFQSRGAVHTHALIAYWRKQDLRVLQAMAHARGLGAISTRGTFQKGAEWQRVNGQLRRINHLPAYLAKTFGSYLSKSADKWQQYVDLMPKGYRQLHHGGGWPSTLTEVREEIRCRSARARRRKEREDRILEHWAARDLLVAVLGAEPGNSRSKPAPRVKIDRDVGEYPKLWDSYASS